MKKSKLYLQIPLLLGTVISLFYVPWMIVWAWVLPLPETIDEQLIEATEHGFSGALLYIEYPKKGEQVYAAGWHNKLLKEKANPNALYKIASIGKLYNAAAVTKLVHRKELNLDQTLLHYLPKIAKDIPNSNSITLKMLIQHTSGIPNYTDTPDYWASVKSNHQENLDLIKGLPARFEPGSDYEYCNTNYLLLELIMRETLGYPPFDFIQSEILKPLGLNNTYASIHEVDKDAIMSGYHVGYPHDLKMDDMGMVATVSDVGAFVRALQAPGLFSPEEYELYRSLYPAEHTGWVPGYQSIARYHEELDAVVVLFTSTTDKDLYLWNISEIVYERIIDITTNNTRH